MPQPTTATARPLWVLSALLGLATLGLIVWFAGVIPETGCAAPARPGVNALGAFQMARTRADIEAVFGAEGDPCRPGMIAALDRANRMDLYVFIATYGAFLATFLLAMTRSGGGTVAGAGLLMLGAGLGFDVLETATQLRLTGELPGSEGALTTLAIGSAGKFTILALVALCAGVAMLVRGGLTGRLAGLGCLAGGVLALVGLTNEPARALLALGNGIAWLLMLVYAVAVALRPRPA
jgi:hypothetical protein